MLTSFAYGSYYHLPLCKNSELVILEWVRSELTPQQLFGEVKEETYLKIKMPDSLSLSDLVFEHSLSLPPDTSSIHALAPRNVDTQEGVLRSKHLQPSKARAD